MTLNEMDQINKDRFRSNETVQRVKKLFELKNAYLRTYSLNSLLHYTNVDYED